MSPADAQAAPPRWMTWEEFAALPDDGTERDLINGQVRVWGPRMTARNHFHSWIESQIVHLLKHWLSTAPRQGGGVVSGEAGFLLQRTPDSLVGVDVAYVSAEVRAATGPAHSFFNGPPVLAVEILSPSDSCEQVATKVARSLDVGAVVWVVDPYFQSVAVHRPGQPVETFNRTQELVGDPELPGFRVPVAAIFE